MSTNTSTHPLRLYRIWSHLGWRDVRVRYSDTTLGPFWSASALFAVVIGSSLAVSVLASQPLFENSATLALKLTLWTLLLTCISESSEIFHLESSLLLNSTIPEEILILRMVWRNFIFYLHNLLVVIIFLLIQSPSTIYRVLFLLPYGLIISLLMIFPGYLIARVGTRYRDLRVLIPSLLQLVFFASPILWVAPDTGPGRLATNVNPVAWIVETGYDITILGTIGIRYGVHLFVLLISTLGLSEVVRRYTTSVRNLL